MTPWTVARQAPLSMGFSRQEYWSGLPLPPPGDLPHPGNEPASLGSPALAGRFFPTTQPGKPPVKTYCSQINKYIFFKKKYIVYQQGRDYEFFLYSLHTFQNF